MLSAAISGGLMGMAFSKAVAAGANTREGKVMTVAGLAGLGVFGCVSLIFTWDFSTRGRAGTHAISLLLALLCRLSVQDMAGPTAYYK